MHCCNVSVCAYWFYVQCLTTFRLIYSRQCYQGALWQKYVTYAYTTLSILWLHAFITQTPICAVFSGLEAFNIMTFENKSNEVWRELPVLYKSDISVPRIADVLLRKSHFKTAILYLLEYKITLCDCLYDCLEETWSEGKITTYCL